MPVAVIVGSAFSDGAAPPALLGTRLRPTPIDTPWGTVTLFSLPDRTDAYVLFRHGVPHRYLPNQIPYRAHAAALAEIGCEALLVTSSVGVLDRAIPLAQPLLLDDLLMLDNRLPDGTTATMFTEPADGQGHLVIDGGLFSAPLSAQVERMGAALGWSSAPRVTFAYVGGPRTKTPAENRYLATTGAHVNSMTVGPEVVLANELEIPTAAVVVGHKYSVPGNDDPLDATSIADSLTTARAATERLVALFLRTATAVPFENRLYRF